MNDSQRHSERNSDNANSTASPGYAYDDNRNLLLGAGRNLTWTSLNKVQQITKRNDLSYTYDAEHQRLKQTTKASRGEILQRSGEWLPSSQNAEPAANLLAGTYDQPLV